MEISSLSSKALLYLILAVASSLLLHIEYLPYWVLFLAIGVLLWRYFIYSGKLKFPNAIFKGLLVLVGFYGVYYSYGLSLSIEAAVTLLVAGLALKPLEVESKRDSYVLIFLCYFVQSQHLLFEQGPISFAFVLVCLFLTLLAQVVVNQSREAKTPLSITGKMFLLSLPLTVFLFFILPRVGPFWALNISTKSGVIGLSESMSPGDISDLAKSDELAFRVAFDGNVPPVNERYWRALILDYYDGETWSTHYSSEINWKVGTIKDIARYQYQIISEAHENRWLFSLENSVPLQKGVGVSEDGLIRSKYKVLNQFQYKAISIDNKAYPHKTLSALQRQAYLQLPKKLNPKTRELANYLYQSAKDEAHFISLLANYYMEKPFVYTLSPGVSDGEHRVDDFLFREFKGFCAHYAGSAVYLIRSAGVPARIVMGYMGAEKNEVGNYYSVYQYDAHAWVEVWDKQRGWIRIDPTSWVSPIRIEQGIAQAAENEFVGFKSESRMLKTLRHQLQALNYYWNDWMLAYKGDKQQEFMDALLGERNPLEYALIITVAFIGVLIFLFLVVLSAQIFNRQPLHLILFKRYLSALKQAGIQVEQSMTLSEIEARVSSSYPCLLEKSSLVTTYLEACLYQKESSVISTEDEKKIKSLIRAIARYKKNN